MIFLIFKIWKSIEYQNCWKLCAEDLKVHLSKCEVFVCDNSGCREVFENSSTVKDHIKEEHKKGSPEHYTFSYYICHSKNQSEKEVNKNYVRILPSDW